MEIFCAPSLSHATRFVLIEGKYYIRTLRMVSNNGIYAYKLVGCNFGENVVELKLISKGNEDYHYFEDGNTNNLIKKLSCGLFWFEKEKNESMEEFLLQFDNKKVAV